MGSSHLGHRGTIGAFGNGDDAARLPRVSHVHPAPAWRSHPIVPFIQRSMSIAILALGVAGWSLFAIRAVQSILVSAFRQDPSLIYLVDWRVYFAGASDLWERDLYVDGGVAVGNLPMPVDFFNLPPMSAALALPLVPFGLDTGGLIWVVAGAIALGATAYLTARMMDVRYAPVVVGTLLFIYILQWNFAGNIVIGNVNPFVLLSLAGFAWCHLAGRDRSAGALLGLAVSLKAWPLLLVFVVVRERRWQELATALAFVACQGLIFLLWLGPEAGPAITSALLANISVAPDTVLLWTSWARVAIDWWPSWGSLAVAAVLVVIPAVGRLGIGLAILAGLSLIPNLWDHYLPTFAFAFLLIASSDELIRTLRMRQLACDLHRLRPAHRRVRHS